jgi:hypothetical protein
VSGRTLGVLHARSYCCVIALVPLANCMLHVGEMRLITATVYVFSNLLNRTWGGIETATSSPKGQ